MSTAQKQDLAVFKDHSIVQNSKKFLSLVSYVEGTSPTWLISGLIENYVLGSCNLINGSGTVKPKTNSRVLMFSFLQDTGAYDKYFKKISGIHLNGRANFKFISLLDSLSESPDHILKKISQETESFNGNDRPLTIIIDSPEIFLHVTSSEVNKYLSFLQSLQRKATNLVLISAIDYGLIDFQSVEPRTIEFKHTDFLAKILHKTNLVFNLKPLETGRADDVTGTLSITRGLVDSVDVVEREYLYLINKEGNIKLFFR